MRVDLRKDPAVKGIARRTGLDRFQVVGRLHAVWSWADQQLRNGNAVGVTAEDLDEEAEHPGFAQAMADERWLKILSTGLVFPDFDRHNGKPAKERALTAKRVKRHRDGAGVTPPLPEKRRVVTINNLPVANSTAPAQLTEKPPEEKSKSTPRARTRSEAKAQQVMREAAEAKARAVPPPAALIEEFVHHPVDHFDTRHRASQAEPVAIPWWHSVEGITNKGAEHGLRVLADESFAEFKARVIAAEGPGPWEDEQPEPVRERVEFHRAVSG